MNTRIDPSTGLPGATPRLRALRTSPVRRVLALTAVGAVAVTLAACGSSSSASTTSTTAAAGKGAAGAGAGTGTGGTTRRFPGTSGTIAAINGTSLEVQSPSSQTTVNYTSTTTFQQTVSATAADVTVGSCISAFGAPSSGASSSTTRAFGEPVTATTVTITQPTSGSCTAGFGGGRSRRRWGDRRGLPARWHGNPALGRGRIPRRELRGRVGRGDLGQR